MIHWLKDSKAWWRSSKVLSGSLCSKKDSSSSPSLSSLLPAITSSQIAPLGLVPCPRRASSYEEEYVVVGRGDEDDGRRLIHGNPTGSTDEDNLPSTGEMIELKKTTPFSIFDSYFDVDKKEDIPDKGNLLKSILYARDYKTPHFWLTGNHEHGMPLQPELILEDVGRNRAAKTVTIEDRPHLPGKHASVHPRDHGAAVKKMIDDWMSHGVEPEVNEAECGNFRSTKLEEV